MKKKFNFKAFGIKVKLKAKKHLPLITAVGTIAAYGFSLYSAITESGKTRELLKEEEQKKGEKLTLKEKVKIIVPNMKKTIISSTVTGTGIVGTALIGEHLAATATAAGVAIASRYKKHLEKTEELYGKDANMKIDAEIRKDEIKELEVSIPKARNDRALFLLPDFGPIVKDHSGKSIGKRVFDKVFIESDLITVSKALDWINQSIYNEYGWSGECPVNEFLRMLSPDGSKVYCRDDVKDYGWSCEYLSSMVYGYTGEIAMLQYGIYPVYADEEKGEIDYYEVCWDYDPVPFYRDFDALDENPEKLFIENGYSLPY